MNCEEARRWIGAYCDGELDAVRSVEIEHHLQGCEGCRTADENLRVLGEAARKASFDAPADLRASVLARLQKSQPGAEVVSRPFVRAWMLRGLALAAAVLLGFFVARTLYRGTEERVLLAELTDSHIRSLAGTHLTDVVSSDQHTVRPWFEGKIDFAPPVEELSSQGFPLVGGRVEYISGHPVAALVYERRKHFINLFVWPDERPSSEMKTETPQRGYNVAHWRAGGMSFWAISEVATAELQKFSATYVEAMGAPGVR